MRVRLPCASSRRSRRRSDLEPVRPGRQAHGQRLHTKRGRTPTRVRRASTSALPIGIDRLVRVGQTGFSQRQILGCIRAPQLGQVPTLRIGLSHDDDAHALTRRQCQRLGRLQGALSYLASTERIRQLYMSDTIGRREEHCRMTCELACRAGTSRCLPNSERFADDEQADGNGFGTTPVSSVRPAPPPAATRAARRARHGPHRLAAPATPVPSLPHPDSAPRPSPLPTRMLGLRGHGAGPTARRHLRRPRHSATPPLLRIEQSIDRERPAPHVSRSHRRGVR